MGCFLYGWNNKEDENLYTTKKLSNACIGQLWFPLIEQ